MAGRSLQAREPVTRGIGNVFADLGFPDGAEREAKPRLSYAVDQLLDDRRRSQAQAAKIMGLSQAKVSALRTFKLAGISRRAAD